MSFEYDCDFMNSIDLINNIEQIYSDYKIPINLRNHMTTAANLSKTIIDNWSGQQINKDNIILSLLLHDLGNIVKFDLETETGLKLIDPIDLKDIDGLKQIRKEFIEKYDDDDHIVTNKILDELKVNERVKKIVKKHVFNNNEDTLKSLDWDVKIAAYSDQRIGPYGILSLEDRFNELKKRYANRDHARVNNSKIDLFIDCAFKIEKQIFANTKIKPEDIK